MGRTLNISVTCLFAVAFTFFPESGSHGNVLDPTACVRAPSAECLLDLAVHTFQGIHVEHEERPKLSSTLALMTARLQIEDRWNIRIIAGQDALRAREDDAAGIALSLAEYDLIRGAPSAEESINNAITKFLDWSKQGEIIDIIDVCARRFEFIGLLDATNGIWLKASS